MLTYLKGLFGRTKSPVEPAPEPVALVRATVSGQAAGPDPLADILGNIAEIQSKVAAGVPKITYSAKATESGYRMIHGTRHYWCPKCGGHTKLTKDADHCADHRAKKSGSAVVGRFKQGF